MLNSSQKQTLHPLAGCGPSNLHLPRLSLISRHPCASRPSSPSPNSRGPCARDGGPKRESALDSTDTRRTGPTGRAYRDAALERRNCSSYNAVSFRALLLGFLPHDTTLTLGYPNRAALLAIYFGGFRGPSANNPFRPPSILSGKSTSPTLFLHFAASFDSAWTSAIFCARSTASRPKPRATSSAPYSRTSFSRRG